MMFLEMSAARPTTSCGNIHGYKVQPRQVPIDASRIMDILKNFYAHGMPTYRATDKYSRYYRVISDSENKYEMGITSIWTDELPTNDITWMVRRASLRFNHKYGADRAMVAFPVPPAIYDASMEALQVLKKSVKNPFYLSGCIKGFDGTQGNPTTNSDMCCDYFGLLERNSQSIRTKSDPSYPSLYIMGLSSKEADGIDPHIILTHPNACLADSWRF